MLRTSHESFSVSSTFRLLGLIELERSASRKASRFSGSSFRNVSTAATSSVIWSGSAWSMSWIVASIDFFGIALNAPQSHVEVGEQDVVLEAVLVHDRRERKRPDDRLGVVIEHPAPRLIGLLDLVPELPRHLACLFGTDHRRRIL